MRTSISVKWNITNFRTGGGHMEMEKNKKNRYGFDFTPIGLDIKTFREAASPSNRTGRETSKPRSFGIYRNNIRYASTRTYFQKKQIPKVPCGNA